MKLTLRYVHHFTDRHGHERLYYRRRGVRIALRGPVGSPEFWEDYNAAHEGRIETRDGLKVGSMRWLCAQYYQTAAFKALQSRTQTVRRGILERFCQRHGDKSYRTLRAKHLRRIRDTMASKPESANSLIKALRQLFRWAVEDDEMESNPAANVAYLAPKNKGGFHAWTLSEVEQFESAHPVGTKARLAFALLLYTGQRRGDMVKMGRQHVRDGWLTVTQGKTGKRLEIPVLPQLQEILDASPLGDMTFLVTQFGKPFTANGFGNWFRKQCDKAGLKHCSSHGLRKACAARLAIEGNSVHEIAAITGHDSLKEVQRYTRGAEQRSLAENVARRNRK